MANPKWILTREGCLSLSMAQQSVNVTSQSVKWINTAFSFLCNFASKNFQKQQSTKKILLTLFAMLGIMVPSVQKKDLVAYFSAQGHTEAVAERIAELMGADIYRTEAADPFAENPYDASDRIKKTYGNRKCNAVEIWNDISRKAGVPFDYINTLIMVDNWLPNFDMNEQVLIDKHIPENLEKISAEISARKHWLEPVTEEERQQHQGFMERTGIDPEKGFVLQSQDYFTVTDACIGWGACVAVCPKGNYSLSGKGVNIEGDCEFCFACIQNCPLKAIQFVKNENDPFLSKGEKNPNARYRNEHISLVDIKRANQQF